MPAIHILKLFTQEVSPDIEAYPETLNLQIRNRILRQSSGMEPYLETTQRGLAQGSMAVIMFLIICIKSFYVLHIIYSATKFLLVKVSLSFHLATEDKLVL